MIETPMALWSIKLSSRNKNIGKHEKLSQNSWLSCDRPFLFRSITIRKNILLNNNSWFSRLDWNRHGKARAVFFFYPRKKKFNPRKFSIFCPRIFQTGREKNLENNPRKQNVPEKKNWKFCPRKKKPSREKNAKFCPRKSKKYPRKNPVQNI